MTNPWVIASAFFLALALFGTVVFVIWYSRPEAEISAPSTAVLNILLPQPQRHYRLHPRAPPATSTLPAPPPGVIAIGGYVQITGTGGGAGLRLRDAAWLGTTHALAGRGR